MEPASEAPCGEPSSRACWPSSAEALAGPVCPVERDPPDPACDARPVVGAVIIVRDDGGAEVATVTTDGNGRFSVDLAPGSYEVVPQEVEGLMHAADSVAVELREGTDPEPVMLAYDTGIR
jgi:hypothetical protein